MMPRKLLAACLIGVLTLSGATQADAEPKVVEADLLIAGATESGWAAAIQAARMGVKRIVVVNDYEWLGGQFTLQSLVAIDENRSEEEGKRRELRRQPSIPRSGLFKELIDGIEQFNLETYGHPQPGNTHVSTTTRPADAEAVFRALIQPYVDRGQITIRSRLYPIAATLADDGKTLQSVRFRSTAPDASEENDLIVQAKITIDATDWGDVIRLSGAAFEYGPDLQSKYGEPLAPVKREGYPLTDMNPLMYTAILERTDEDHTIKKPAHYDERRYTGTTNLLSAENAALKWGGKPLDGGMAYEYAINARRIVDPQWVKRPDSTEWLMLGWYIQDYPLDVLPPHVCAALEKLEPGASQKNIVLMSRAQREIVYQDAKQHTLGMIYHMQTTLREKLGDHPRSLWRYRLTDEFGTPDKMPPLPYIREGLRMQAMYMMRQQDVTHLGEKSETYSRAMYHDGLLAWQFEYDFHPTQRVFLDGEEPGNAWRIHFKPGRRWGPPYTGLSVFPLRSMIPAKIDGLLGAQKNLGYSSLVSAAFRLHDQCVHVGQAAGAAAAIALEHDQPLRELPFDRTRLNQIRAGLCQPGEGVAMAIWPFRDLETSHAAYAAVQMLAAGGMLPLVHNEVDFKAGTPASDAWKAAVIALTQKVKQQPPTEIPTRAATTRGEFALAWWNAIRDLPDVPYQRVAPNDADGDSVEDANDPLPLDADNASLPRAARVADATDGFPDPLADDSPLKSQPIRGFNFANQQAAKAEPFITDHGLPFDAERGYGWSTDMTANVRTRGDNQQPLRDAFLFTRDAARWECAVPNGAWQVTVCVGDAAHPQLGQRLQVEGQPAIDNATTAAGQFLEHTHEVTIQDGRLTLNLGPQPPMQNTCVNWIRLIRLAK